MIARRVEMVARRVEIDLFMKAALNFSLMSEYVKEEKKVQSRND